jgi:ppGpp synthetase/RelA/SpoT-type nucleotidyltranferase
LEAEGRLEILKTEMQDRVSELEDEQFVPIPLRTAPSWLDKTPQLIYDFVNLYYSREHYEALAKTAQSLIERALKDLRDSNEEEVQAKVTSRAKTGMSLEEKLKMRNEERKLEGKKEFGTSDDILSDVVDLAGVRVVLYTPNEAQRNKVREVIRSIWGPGVEEKIHDGSNASATNGAIAGKNKRYIRRHLGYQAEHYRTPMTEDQSTDMYEWKPYDKVEIQVVSALGHAWAEAGHDVLYKTHAYGPPSIQEQRILDALSGLIISGDLLLEQFRELVTKRTYARWEHPEQFTSFIRESDVLQRQEEQDGTKSYAEYQNHFASEGIDILFRFLVKTRNNYPLAVRNALRDLRYPQDPKTGLEEELKQFSPPLHPPLCLLAPLCLISHFLRRGKQKGKQSKTEYSMREKCSIMIDALLLLQTFAGSSDAARAFLLQPGVTMTNDQKVGLNFVLSNPSRRDCLDGFQTFRPDVWSDELELAWGWFQQQVPDDRSLCGLFFRLSEMGVPAKVLDDRKRLKELSIGSLNTLVFKKV